VDTVVPFLNRVRRFVHANDGEYESDKEEGKHKQLPEWPGFPKKQSQSEH
jgi:hypothetical protein